MENPCAAPTACSRSSSSCAATAWSPRETLAEQLEVSVRTIYRDVRDLQTAGVPIDGAAGVGYLLRPGFQLPPLMFTACRDRGADRRRAHGQGLGGPRASPRAAAEALVKIGAVVPPERMRAAGSVPIFAPGFALRRRRCATASTWSAQAIDGRRKTRFAYRDGEGSADRAHRAAAGAAFLGRHVDARRLVRAPRRFPHLPRRPRRASSQSPTSRFAAAKRQDAARTISPASPARRDQLLVVGRRPAPSST